MIQIQMCTSREFSKLVKKKKVICFGGGQKLFDICEAYDVSTQLIYIVDKYKKGTTLRIQGLEIPVLSMEQIGEEIRGSVPVITSIRYADEMIAELDRMEQCNQLPFYLPELFDNTKEQCGEPFMASMISEKPQQIPKIIHYFWFGGGEISAEFRRNIESWKQNCPDYEIKCWNEDNYNISKNTYMEQAYRAKKWGFVPDYARLDIIYRYGGIYLDIDVEVCRPLDELLRFEMFCGFENMSQVNLGSGFGAVKGNKLVGAMMKAYEGERFVRQDGTMNLIPSPVYQTKTLVEFGLRRNGRSQKLGNAVVFAPEYLSPINEFGFGSPTKNTYSIHHYAATWFGDKERHEKERIMKNYRDILRRMESSVRDRK